MQFTLDILSTIAKLIVCVFLLRLLMPLVRADFRNQVGQFVLRVTNPLVLVLRKVLPPAKRLDVASLAALLLVHFACTAFLMLVARAGLDPVYFIAIGFRTLLETILQFYFWVLLAYALLSWFAGSGYNPAAQILSRLSEPVLDPIRRVVPPLAGIDLSVVIALLAIQLLLRFV